VSVLATSKHSRFRTPLPSDLFRFPTTAVYEVVKKKEAEKRAELRNTEGAEPSFGQIVQQQWEERKKELRLNEHKNNPGSG